MPGEISVASLEERLAAEPFSVDMLTDVCKAARSMHFREWYANRALFDAEHTYYDYVNSHYSEVVPNPESFNTGQTMPDEAFTIGNHYAAARIKADSQRKATITRISNMEEILQNNFDENPTMLQISRQTVSDNTARVQNFGESDRAFHPDVLIREPITGVVKAIQLLRSIRPVGSPTVGGEAWGPVCTLFLQPTEPHHLESYSSFRSQINLTVGHPYAADVGILPEKIRKFDLSTAVELVDSE